MRAALKPYADVRELFPPEARWAAYVLGVFHVLLAEGELEGLNGGADLLLHSTVPLGAGVASSAAIEVAAMRAVVAAYGGQTAGLRLAALCQLVENRVVGAPCGIMDQVTCALGRPDELLALACQPHEITGWHAPPAGYTFIGLDSGVKHAVGGRRYPVVRCAAFMGRAIIREQLRLSSEPEGRLAHLCNLDRLSFAPDSGTCCRPSWTAAPFSSVGERRVIRRRRSSSARCIPSGVPPSIPSGRTAGSGGSCGI
jgi:L-arabinokinase